MTDQKAGASNAPQKTTLSSPRAQVRIRPFHISWAPRWSKDDALFYIGKSWQASMFTLGGDRCEIYGLRIQLGPIRILLCTFDIPEAVNA